MLLQKARRLLLALALATPLALAAPRSKRLGASVRRDDLPERQRKGDVAGIPPPRLQCDREDSNAKTPRRRDVRVSLWTLRHCAFALKAVVVQWEAA